MRIEDHLGRQMKRAREDANLTLDELGKRMGTYIGRPLTAQAVWQMENGKRDFKAAQVLALCLALDMPLAYLFSAPEGEALELESHHKLTKRETDHLFRWTGHVTGVADSMYEALVGAQKMQRTLIDVRRLLREVDADAGRTEAAVLTLYRGQAPANDQGDDILNDLAAGLDPASPTYAEDVLARIRTNKRGATDE